MIKYHISTKASNEKKVQHGENHFQLSSNNRYPDDKYDRWWYNNTNSAWSAISTNATINYAEEEFEVPSRVLQTAAATKSTNQQFVINWSSDNTSTKFSYVLHFYEVQDTSKTGSRDFYINFRGTQNFTVPYPGSIGKAWVRFLVEGFTDYNVSLKASPNSTLPPAMNAFELYEVATLGIPTYDKDGNFLNQFIINV